MRSTPAQLHARASLAHAPLSLFRLRTRCRCSRALRALQIKDGSKWQSNGGFWWSLIIYNLPNGIGGVEQDLGGGEWVSLETLEQLGQQWVLEPPSNMAGPKEATVRVTDADGKVYGTYKVAFPCSDTCSDNTDATWEMM
jgi:hypothetical protein